MAQHSAEGRLLMLAGIDSRVNPLIQRLALRSCIAKALQAFLSTSIGHGHHLEVGPERIVKRICSGSEVV